MCILERDWQCDFESNFWEESDCNWRYSKTLMSSFGFGTTANLRFQREKVTGTENGYWKRIDTKTGSFQKKIWIQFSDKLNINK